MVSLNLLRKWTGCLLKPYFLHYVTVVFCNKFKYSRITELFTISILPVGIYAYIVTRHYSITLKSEIDHRQNGFWKNNLEVPMFVSLNAT